MRNDLPILVLGEPRTGTSLAMQMLEAAGVPCHGSWPDFETDLGFDPRWPQIRSLGAVAIKVLDPINLPQALATWPQYQLPANLICTSRIRRNEQAKSLAKMINGTARLSHARKFAKSLRETTPRHQKLVRGLNPIGWKLVLHFELLIKDPLQHAENLCGVLESDVKPETVAAVVRARDINCHPTLLEQELLAEREQRTGVENG